MAFLFLAILLFALFFLSRHMTKLFSKLFMKLFHSQHVMIYLLSFIFLPGVVLHELSHLLLANLLFVRTGEVEFFPEIHDTEVKMGSVAIDRTDPLRRFLIGVAPVIGGLGVLLAASSLLLDTILSWKSMALFYVVFQIANTMFSSSKDMEGSIGFLVGMSIIGAILQLLGFSLWGLFLRIVTNSYVIHVVFHINIFLLLAIGLDIFLILFFEGLVRLRGDH